jgi:transcription initiation factor TFIIIB Brf1 subunit/transcription initiation factor TFIIB
MALADYASMADHDPDACPEHGRPAVKEYDFGLRDATVVRWACGCCGCFIGDSLDDAGTYHRSYASAQGRARLAVARANAR